MIERLVYSDDGWNEAQNKINELVDFCNNLSNNVPITITEKSKEFEWKVDDCFKFKLVDIQKRKIIYNEVSKRFSAIDSVGEDRLSSKNFSSAGEVVEFYNKYYADSFIRITNEEFLENSINEWRIGDCFKFRVYQGSFQNRRIIYENDHYTLVDNTGLHRSSNFATINGLIKSYSSFQCTKITYAEFMSTHRPKIVCLCGSTSFIHAFEQANLEETLKGNIVLSIGSHRRTDRELGLTEEQKEKLDALHLKKIDMADEVIILNVNGYIGSSTKKEVEYAKSLGKTIKFLEEYNYARKMYTLMDSCNDSINIRF